MKISFLCNPVYPNGWSPNDTRLGGTEESVVEWSRLLGARGHSVVVYQNGFTGTRDGVVYADRDNFQDRGGVTINLKSSEVPPHGPTLYLTNETDASRLDLSAYDCVIWPSRWARDNIPVNNPNLEVLPHGYDSSQIYPGKKIPGQCLYASSPDRGLDFLLGVWPDIVRRVPSATLTVTYGVSGDLGPNVIALGDVDNETMADLFRTSEIWCHPCSGGELFGITAVKAQAAGCVPVYFPTMALSETVRHGVRSTPRSLVEDLVHVLQSEPDREAIRGALSQERFVDWEESTTQLEKMLYRYANL